MSNILPKKSWHVYNEENREKVRRDQEQALIKQEISLNKQRQDERDGRLELLRKRQQGIKPEGKILDNDSATPTTCRDEKRVERFELFPDQADATNRLESKKTDAQKSKEERSLRTNPMSLGSCLNVKSPSWYEKSIENEKVPFDVSNSRLRMADKLVQLKEDPYTAWKDLKKDASLGQPRTKRRKSSNEGTTSSDKSNLARPVREHYYGRKDHNKFGP